MTNFIIRSLMATTVLCATVQAAQIQFTFDPARVTSATLESTDYTPGIPWLGINDTVSDRVFTAAANAVGEYEPLSSGGTGGFGVVKLCGKFALKYSSGYPGEEQKLISAHQLLRGCSGFSVPQFYGVAKVTVRYSGDVGNVQVYGKVASTTKYWDEVKKLGLGDDRKAADHLKTLGQALGDFQAASAQGNYTVTTLVHYDFNPGNAMPTATGVALIDNGFVQRGHPYLDPAYFLGFIGKWDKTLGGFDRICRAFLSGYVVSASNSIKDAVSVKLKDQFLDNVNTDIYSGTGVTCLWTSRVANANQIEQIMIGAWAASINAYSGMGNARFGSRYAYNAAGNGTSTFGNGAAMHTTRVQPPKAAGAAAGASAFGNGADMHTTRVQPPKAAGAAAGAGYGYNPYGAVPSNVGGVGAMVVVQQQTAVAGAVRSGEELGDTTTPNARYRKHPDGRNVRM